MSHFRLEASPINQRPYDVRHAYLSWSRVLYVARAYDDWEHLTRDRTSVRDVDPEALRVGESDVVEGDHVDAETARRSKRLWPREHRSTRDPRNPRQLQPHMHSPRVPHHKERLPQLRGLSPHSHAHKRVHNLTVAVRKDDKLKREVSGY